MNCLNVCIFRGQILQTCGIKHYCRNQFIFIFLILYNCRFIIRQTLSRKNMFFFSVRQLIKTEMNGLLKRNTRKLRRNLCWKCLSLLSDADDRNNLTESFSMHIMIKENKPFWLKENHITRLETHYLRITNTYMLLNFW